jgi:tetratricopeptide (TPR) repeat protein
MQTPSRLRKSLVRVFVIASVVMLAPQLSNAQDDVVPPPSPNVTRSSGRGSIVGRVVLPSGQPVTERCRVTLTSMRENDLTVFTDNNGGFGFANLPEATYTIEATGDVKLYETVSQEVRLVHGMQVRLVINLKEKNPTHGSNAGRVVSATEVDPNIPSAARKEYEKGTLLAAQEKITEAIDRFKAAIGIYPAYLIARNDLGVQYLKLKRLPEAVEQFEEAIQINSKAFNPRLNMGIALVNLKRYTEAVDHLTQAISINSSSPSAHLYLGIAALETDDLETAFREIDTSQSIGGKDFSVAHFFRARIALKRGERPLAVAQLNAYLENAPTGEYAAKAKALLDQLKEN